MDRYNVVRNVLGDCLSMVLSKLLTSQSSFLLLFSSNLVSILFEPKKHAHCFSL